jgi:hypothetical protein
MHTHYGAPYISVSLTKIAVFDLHSCCQVAKIYGITRLKSRIRYQKPHLL